MHDEQGNTRRDKRIPGEQIEQRGIIQDALGLAIQEAKPIVEGALAGWGAHKLSQGKHPPPVRKGD